MSNITTALPLWAFVIMISFLFCILRSASRSDFGRFSRGSSLVLEDFLSWLIAVIKVSTQQDNLSSKQMLLLLNLGSFELLLVDPKCALSLILR